VKGDPRGDSGKINGIVYALNCSEGKFFLGHLFPPRVHNPAPAAAFQDVVGRNLSP